VLREHTFVGALGGTQVLLQQGSKLYLVDVGPLSRDLMLQQALRRCGRFGAGVVLEPPVELGAAVAMGLEQQQAEGRLTDADGNRVRKLIQ
jgi:DNA mismatch repair protein MLH1